MADEPSREPTPDSAWRTSDAVRGRFQMIGSILLSLRSAVAPQSLACWDVAMDIIQQQIVEASRAAFLRGVEYGHAEEALDQATRETQASLDRLIETFVETTPTVMH